jgi:hypothetical protein
MAACGPLDGKLQSTKSSVSNTDQHFWTSESPCRNRARKAYLASTSLWIMLMEEQRSDNTKSPGINTEGLPTIDVGGHEIFLAAYVVKIAQSMIEANFVQLLASRRTFRDGKIDQPDRQSGPHRHSFRARRPESHGSHCQVDTGKHQNYGHTEIAQSSLSLVQSFEAKENQQLSSITACKRDRSFRITRQSQNRPEGRRQTYQRDSATRCST